MGGRKRKKRGGEGNKERPSFPLSPREEPAALAPGDAKAPRGTAGGCGWGSPTGGQPSAPTQQQCQGAGGCPLPGDSPQVAAGRVLVVVLRLGVPKQHLGGGGQDGERARRCPWGRPGKAKGPAGLPTPRHPGHGCGQSGPASPASPGAFMAQPRQPPVGRAAVLELMEPSLGPPRPAPVPLSGRGERRGRGSPGAE